MAKAKRLFLYLHTHWDREWYWPFEAFRTEAVSVVTDVVKRLESKELPNFTLDGQSCLLEDVTEIDPSLADRISKLMSDRVLSAGPWYVLNDQMLVGGESIIRNLLIGMSVASRFGKPSMVGYCPDTFGHSHDLPRILKGFGIDTAVVWRGVPRLDDGPVFRWKSADGSSVLAYHLTKGYYQTAFHEDRTPESLAEYLMSYLCLPDDDRLSESSGPPAFDKTLNAALIPVGGDHLFAPIDFKRKLSQAEDELAAHWKKRAKGTQRSSPPDIKAVRLDEFVSDMTHHMKSEIAAVRLLDQELRDNSAAQFYERAFMLPGVLSTRLYLKRENRIAERRLGMQIEPLLSLLHASGAMSSMPKLQLDHAWKILLKNQPHDSICGCSVDSVHQEMMTRYRSVHHVLDTLERQARQSIAVTGAKTLQPAKEMTHAAVAEKSSARSKAATKSRQELKAEPKLSQARISCSPAAVLDPEFEANRLAVYNLSSSPVAAPVRLRWAATPDSPDLPKSSRVQVGWVHESEDVLSELGGVPTFKKVKLLEGWMWPGAVPAWGCKITDWNHLFETSEEDKSNDVRFVDQRLSNEFFSIEIEAKTGALIVRHLDTKTKGRARLGEETDKSYRLVHTIKDVGDAGDTYNFDPLFGDEAIQATYMTTTVGQTGPLVGSIYVQYKMEIPRGAVVRDRLKKANAEDPTTFSRALEVFHHQFTTEITLKRGVPVVFFETTFSNLSRDHRLEVSLDTGAKVERTYSENHFSLIERKPPAKVDPNLFAVKSATEAPLDRFPCQRFFLANGQAFFNVGLPEYGVEDSSVSLTLLRAVSFLSRPKLRTRGGGAGPSLPTPDANCKIVQRVQYGWAPLSVFSKDTSNGKKKSKAAALTDSERVAAYRLAALFDEPLWATQSRQPEADISGSIIRLDTTAVIITAIKPAQEEEGIVIRMLNVTASKQRADLEACLDVKKARLVDLAETTIEKLKEVDREDTVFNGPTGDDFHYFRLEFAPFELVSVMLVLPKD